MASSSTRRSWLWLQKRLLLWEPASPSISASPCLSDPGRNLQRFPLGSPSENLQRPPGLRCLAEPAGTVSLPKQSTHLPTAQGQPHKPTRLLLNRFLPP